VWWRWGSWLAGAALLIVAGATFMLTVQVRDSGGRAVACGSAWDVVAGRTGWQQWWAADLADPAGRAQLARTERCPGAVNGRIVASAAVAVGAVAIVAVGGLVELRRARTRRAQRRTAGRLHLVGTGVSVLGGVLTAAGLVGIALLTADPNAPLFLYVSRTAVVLVGLLLVLPAVLLIALGRGLSVLAEHVAAGERGRDETP
jgi:hypothetical protein